MANTLTVTAPSTVILTAQIPVKIVLLKSGETCDRLCPFLRNRFYQEGTCSLFDCASLAALTEDTFQRAAACLQTFGS